jgi:ABC-2 type transport system permease protein
MNTTFHHASEPSLLGIYLREAGSELLRTWRTPAFVLPTLLFPLVFYALFALLLPGRWGSYDKAIYLLATYGVFGIMGPALFGFGVGLAQERENGLLALRSVLPMPPGAYFAAKIAMSLLFGAAVVLLLTGAAFVAGKADFAFSSWLTLFGVLVLGALPFCALGLWVGTLVNGQAAVAVVNLVYLPMAVLSGLWMPLIVFPAVMQKLAVIWPSWHLAQIALGVIGQIEGVNYLLHAGVLALVTLLFLSLAALRLGRGE